MIVVLQDRSSVHRRAVPDGAGPHRHLRAQPTADRSQRGGRLEGEDGGAAYRGVEEDGDGREEEVELSGSWARERKRGNWVEGKTPLCSIFMKLKVQLGKYTLEVKPNASHEYCSLPSDRLFTKLPPQLSSYA